MGTALGAIDRGEAPSPPAQGAALLAWRGRTEPSTPGRPLAPPEAATTGTVGHSG
eukprot:CAMPEP_0174380588 /NCGR_PEP_ID=MMETSP0811_2-20130205/123473_1 /TAXON_ID=73025 ORGANISM="Eutreptiella gymnastica-like, Strain CCMP1594" /NCGR_SAMPLE_ID=MMETSP0811_2 /ASSEMBLY_ACC=CAM_ASM_000667 /LENGTH=54 /DNA_ID=CAMNT_0015533501 /DNA_START=1170 /DNA_END=1330 /DNA_ORIENTATION=-